MSDTQSVPEPEFCLEEATIDELHWAITTGRTTCGAVVRQLHRSSTGP